MKVSRDSEAVPRVLLLLLVLSTAIFLWRGVAINLEQAYSNILSHYDFRARYLSAHSLKAGENPYSADPSLPAGTLAKELGVPFDHEIYAPGVLVWIVPLTALDFSTARAVFLLIKIVIIGFSVVLMARMAGATSWGPEAALAVALTFGFETGIRELTVGQLNFVVLFLLCVSIDRIGRGRDWFGGVMLGAAMVVKPIPALLLLPLLLLGRYRAIYGAVAFFAGYTASMILLFGLEAHLDHGRAVFGTALGMNSWWANQSFLGLLVRIGKENHFTEPWFDVRVVVRLAWMALAGGLVSLATLVTLFRSRVDVRWTLSAWLVVALLINPRSWDHYWVWCLPAAIQLGSELLRRGRRSELVGFAILYLLLSFPGQYWKDFEILHQGPLIPLGSSQTAAALALLVSMTVVEPQRIGATPTSRSQTPRAMAR